jgi:protein tyrosine phosphatase (PTP) superfamily phosphohydrolase (DUF442 family)
MTTKNRTELDSMLSTYFTNGGKVTYCKTGARSTDMLFDTAQFPTAGKTSKNVSNTAVKGK